MKTGAVNSVPKGGKVDKRVRGSAKEKHRKQYTV
jgi:hypothetical protein